MSKQIIHEKHITYEVLLEIEGTEELYAHGYLKQVIAHIILDVLYASTSRHDMEIHNPIWRMQECLTQYS